MNLGDALGHIVGGEAAGEDQAGQAREEVEKRVGDRLAGSPVLTLDVGVDQHGVGNSSERFGALEVGDHRVHGLRAADPIGADEGEAAEGEIAFGRFLAVELDDSKPSLAGETKDLLDAAVHKKADRLATRRESANDPRGLLGVNTSRRDGMEVQSNPVRPQFGANDRLIDGGQAADFDLEFAGILQGCENRWNSLGRRNDP